MLLQGREMDVILFSAVRANDKGSVGFLRDERRLNVAITRARYALIVVGHAKTLFRGDATWQRLINHAASNQYGLHHGCWLSSACWMCRLAVLVAAHGIKALCQAYVTQNMNPVLSQQTSPLKRLTYFADHHFLPTAGRSWRPLHCRRSTRRSSGPSARMLNLPRSCFRGSSAKGPGT